MHYNNPYEAFAMYIYHMMNKINICNMLLSNTQYGVDLYCCILNIELQQYNEIKLYCNIFCCIRIQYNTADLGYHCSALQ